eukprot:CAMPEP_0174242262 /NCGR_PEP_ID=MMETSP0417-20130205/27092_1 /TAXON_ID=242541 /ORGANISM="Mayorella sp, Strain BSH-02190019" /LENGTH=282 /DNA_ID=CAMNT_0015321629 /DNA_START=56 /DNA_END=900 /DNA_ORIENTATION=+
MQRRTEKPSLEEFYGTAPLSDAEEELENQETYMREAASANSSAVEHAVAQLNVLFRNEHLQRAAASQTSFSALSSGDLATESVSPSPTVSFSSVAVRPAAAEPRKRPAAAVDGQTSGAQKKMYLSELEPVSHFSEHRDERNQRWVQDRCVVCPDVPSDATLSCPSCFTVLCWECQQHARYREQFRALFVTNCRVEHSRVLRYRVERGKKRRQLKQPGSCEQPTMITGEGPLSSSSAVMSFSSPVDPSRLSLVEQQQHAHAQAHATLIGKSLYSLSVSSSSSS